MPKKCDCAVFAAASSRSFSMRDVAFPHMHNTTSDGDAAIDGLAKILCGAPVLRDEYVRLGMTSEYAARCGRDPHPHAA